MNTKPQEKEYIIMNRTTKETHEVKAQSAQEACEKLGWLIGDCWVREIIMLHRGQCVV